MQKAAQALGLGQHLSCLLGSMVLPAESLLQDPILLHENQAARKDAVLSRLTF